MIDHDVMACLTSDRWGFTPEEVAHAAETAVDTSIDPAAVRLFFCEDEGGAISEHDHKRSYILGLYLQLAEAKRAGKPLNATGTMRCRRDGKRLVAELVQPVQSGRSFGHQFVIGGGANG